MELIVRNNFDGCRVVLIGNGDGLRGRRMGQALRDTHEIVVRFNDAQPCGPEESADLGTETDQRVVNRVWFERRVMLPKARTEKYRRLVVAGLSDWETLRAKLDGSSPQARRDYQVIPYPVLVEAAEASGCTLSQHASAGFVALCWYLLHGAVVSLAGFDWAQTGHYGDDGWEHSPRHNWAGERRAAEAWAADGKIEIL